MRKHFRLQSQALRRWILLGTLSGACSISAMAQSINAAESTPESLKKLSLEDLLQIEISLVSRTPGKLLESPSAAQIVTGEDIRRSGAMTLPEALRLAPNLQVAQQNAHDWAITARGFNGAPLSNNSLADKLLVMIDGRSIYTPLFGGVFWDVQNVLLEDIDRIEVISGPGGALWGANAVNGVINVVTKSAQDTQGLYVSGAAGSFLQDFGAVRYGGNAGTNLFYRVYGQRYDFNSTSLRNGVDANDEWDMTQGGFRLDYLQSAENTFTFQGDFYSGTEGTPTSTTVDGQNFLGRWTHLFHEDSELSVQAYWDRTWRDLSPAGFSDQLNTFDFDFQHRFAIGDRQTLLWGGEYRLMQDEVENTVPLSFIPADRDLQLFSGFLQDEIVLLPERLKLTLGTKLEHNDYSGFEIQPNVRLAWTPTERQTIWAAVSRAVRSPARLDVDELTPSITTLGRRFDSEKVLAYELGYRVRPIERVTLSAAAFYNEYDDLRSINTNPATPPPLIFSNDQRANSWGVELSGNFQATDWWRLRGGYTYLDKNIWATSPAVLRGSDTFEANDPTHQVLFQSIMDLPWHFQFDTVARYVTELQSPAIQAYFTIDIRVAWQFKNLEISLVGQNLCDNQHPEFTSQEIPRSVYGKVTWRF